MVLIYGGGKLVEVVIVVLVFDCVVFSVLLVDRLLICVSIFILVRVDYIIMLI